MDEMAKLFSSAGKKTQREFLGATWPCYWPDREHFPERNEISR